MWPGIASLNEWIKAIFLRDCSYILEESVLVSRKRNSVDHPDLFISYFQVSPAVQHFAETFMKDLSLRLIKQTMSGVCCVAQGKLYVFSIDVMSLVHLKEKQEKK